MPQLTAHPDHRHADPPELHPGATTEMPDDDLVRCECCDAAIDRVTAYSTWGNGYACRTCSVDYNECVRCGLSVDIVRDRLSTWDGDCVCPTCRDDRYWGCDGCGGLISTGDYCPDCSHQAPTDLILDYSYKPVPRFHGTGPLYLGLELEISARYRHLNSCANVALTELGDLGYLKEDSSIDYGFEIVTHPMSYNWALDHFPWAMLDRLRGAGCSSEGNGLHVHISRAGFGGPTHVFRWLKFFHRNVEPILRIARRESDYATFSERGRRCALDYAKGAHSDRYQAINTQPLTTLELRIFASSLRAAEVKAAIGLAAASVEYTRGLTVADINAFDGWQWPAFATWLRDHPEYSPLLREMETLACAC